MFVHARSSRAFLCVNQSSHTHTREKLSGEWLAGSKEGKTQRSQVIFIYVLYDAKCTPMSTSEVKENKGKTPP